jgi:hypothetical protein
MALAKNLSPIITQLLPVNLKLLLQILLLNKTTPHKLIHKILKNRLLSQHIIFLRNKNKNQRNYKVVMFKINKIVSKENDKMS